MYTTNAIESVHSSFRKVTSKGAFPNEMALMKLLYFRVGELDKKWHGGHLNNWANVLNQLIQNEQFKKRINMYENH
jgi:transposase-like protein